MQSVSSTFHEAAKNELIPVDWKAAISFDKSYNPMLTFFTLDVSTLDGADLLAPDDNNPLQSWDRYLYGDYSSRVIDMEYERGIEFPYSVQSAIADFTLDNHDGYFDPLGSSPIAQYILPKRPVKLFTGFTNVGKIQTFVGVADMPEADTSTRTAKFHANDFLSEMYSLTITETLAQQDIRTDEVLSLIFQQFGLRSSDYSLARARNVIPFLFYEKGKNVGNIFRDLMEAEMGRLWLDEEGVIRFEPRLRVGETSVTTFGDSRIISIESSGIGEVINSVRVRSDVREVQIKQPVYTNMRTAETTGLSANLDSAFKIPALSSGFYPNASLEDPCIEITTPTIGEKTDDSWFTAVTGRHFCHIWGDNNPGELKDQ